MCQCIAILIRCKKSTKQLIAALRGDPSFSRAAEVLKLSALVELNPCVLPNDADAPPDDHHLYFLAQHLTCTSLELLHQLDGQCSSDIDYYRSLSLWKKDNPQASYKGLVGHLNALNQHLAISMLLMMNGCPRRQRIILCRQVRFLETQTHPSQVFLSAAIKTLNRVYTKNELCALLRTVHACDRTELINLYNQDPETLTSDDILRVWDGLTGKLIELLQRYFRGLIDDLIEEAFGK